MTINKQALTDEAISLAFEGSNFGRDDLKNILAETVIDAAAGWRCGYTATTICTELGLLTAKGKASALGFRFISEHVQRETRRLKDELEASAKRIADLSSAVIAPGIMRCAGCGFVLTKNNLNMAAGIITAGDSKTEPCPNDCGPLWPVTWKEQAIEMRDSSEQWFEELQEARQRIAELEARDNPKLVQCWSCKHDIEVLAIADCDGYCPRCAAPIDLDDEPYAGISVKGE